MTRSARVGTPATAISRTWPNGNAALETSASVTAASTSRTGERPHQRQRPPFLGHVGDPGIEPVRQVLPDPGEVVRAEAGAGDDVVAVVGEPGGGEVALDAAARIEHLRIGQPPRRPGDVIGRHPRQRLGGVRAGQLVLGEGRLVEQPDLAWIRAEPAQDGLDAEVTDVTEEWGTLSLMGPRARDVLAAVADAGGANAAFPFGHVREIAVAGVPTRALRVTYVGELGWELHVPIGDTGVVFDALMAASSRTASGLAGYRALRIAPAGEGLPRLGLRHHAQRQSLPGRARLGGEAQVRQGRSSAAAPPSRRPTAGCRSG